MAAIAIWPLAAVAPTLAYLVWRTILALGAVGTRYGAGVAHCCRLILFDIFVDVSRRGKNAEEGQDEKQLEKSHRELSYYETRAGSVRRLQGRDSEMCEVVELRIEFIAFEVLHKPDRYSRRSN